jgi:hypothetical protein
MEPRQAAVVAKLLRYILTASINGGIGYGFARCSSKLRASCPSKRLSGQGIAKLYLSLPIWPNTTRISGRFFGTYMPGCRDHRAPAGVRTCRSQGLGILLVSYGIRRNALRLSQDRCLFILSHSIILRQRGICSAYIDPPGVINRPELPGRPVRPASHRKLDAWWFVDCSFHTPSAGTPFCARSCRFPIKPLASTWYRNSLKAKMDRHDRLTRRKPSRRAKMATRRPFRGPSSPCSYCPHSRQCFWWPWCVSPNVNSRIQPSSPCGNPAMGLGLTDGQRNARTNSSSRPPFPRLPTHSTRKTM